MLCSHCSRDVHPVISVDIDGTLGDYHGHFRRFAEEYLGYALPDGYGGDVEFSDYLELDKRTYRDIKLAYRQGGAKRSMPVFPGATDFMNALREFGVEIWIATTRPYLRLDNIDPDTRHWLERHRIPYDAIIYGDDKYDRLATLLDVRRVVAVVEDLREECLKAAGLGFSVHQPERDHNYASRLAMDVTFGDFPTLLSKVTNRLKRWREDARAVHG